MGSTCQRLCVDKQCETLVTDVPDLHKFQERRKLLEFQDHQLPQSHMQESPIVDDLFHRMNHCAPATKDYAYSAAAQAQKVLQTKLSKTVRTSSDTVNGMVPTQEREQGYDGGYDRKGFADGPGRYLSDQVIFNGMWKNGLPQVGTYSFPKEQVTVKVSSNQNGEISWKDGKRYTGQLQRLCPHGKGRMQFPNGQVIEGNWKKGFPTDSYVQTKNNRSTTSRRLQERVPPLNLTTIKWERVQNTSVIRPQGD